MFFRKAILVLILCSVVVSYGQDGYAVKRKAMVSKQLKARGISDKATVRAMSTVPRHLFVPEDMKNYAYADSALPIGNKQTISQPYIVAFMTQELQLKPSDKVLEVGTGSGYQAAVLAEIVSAVFTIEIIEELGLEAQKLLKQLEYTTIEVKIGDGYHGWPEEAPFNAIMVTAGAKEVPQPLLDQLADGGRMIIPVGTSSYNQQLILLTKKGRENNYRKTSAGSFYSIYEEELDTSKK